MNAESWYLFGQADQSNKGRIQMENFLCISLVLYIKSLRTCTLQFITVSLPKQTKRNCILTLLHGNGSIKKPESALYT